MEDKQKISREERDTSNCGRRIIILIIYTTLSAVWFRSFLQASSGQYLMHVSRLVSQRTSQKDELSPE